MHWNRGSRHLYTLYWHFMKIICKAYLLFYSFLVIKGILQVLFSFIPWSLNFSHLPNCGSNSKKRYTLRLLSTCLGRSTPSLLGIKYPPTLWYSLFDSLRWVPFSSALHISSIYSYYKMVQNLYKSWLLFSKIIWGIWIISDKHWKSKKLKFNGLHLSKKYIPSAKTLYTKDLSNITFNYLCENSPSSLSHF